MNLPQAADLTKQYANTYRATDDFRPAFNMTFPIGSAVKVASRDLQTWTDMRTVVPSAAVANDKLLIGVVSEDWGGFNNTGGVASSTTIATRGSQLVRVTTGGYHPAALIDNSGGAAAAITNGSILNSSEVTPGRLEGVASSAYGATLAQAVLPASGVGSSLGAGTLAQATQTVTLTGTPAVGDNIVVNLLAPYSSSYPGIVQTLTIATVLNASTAASVTTAAAAVVAALNANTAFSTFFIATSAAGVITIKVNSLYAPFSVGYLNGDFFQVALSGTVGNSVTLTTTGTTGATTATAGGATLAGGTGFFGTAPVWVLGLF